MTPSLPVVAIVGRPNVGKSTLFNRLIGERLAIVEDIPGTTRDRVYATGDWNGRDFTVVDTGGLELEPGTDIEARVQDQAAIAMAEAARASAILAGRPTVGFEDVRAVAPAVLNHRVILNYKAKFDRTDAYAVIERLMDSLDETQLGLPGDVQVVKAEA